MKILITGASGLVGSSIVRRALSLDMDVLGQVRQRAVEGLSACVKSIAADTDWRDVLPGRDCVIHCAARVHQMQDTAASPLDAFRAVNTVGTLNLARQSAEAGVKRFVFISSIKVNGELTAANEAFVPHAAGIPDDPYGLSKYEAEQGLKEIAAQTGLEVVIIRPPLVYGPGVKANFLSMMRWIRKGVPLPLGAIDNLRSLVFVENLAHLALLCSQHPQAPGHTFLVSDHQDVSTSALLRQIAHAMGQRPRLIPVPASWLKLAARVVGKGDIAQRLCGNLQLDISDTLQVLDWTPPYRFEQGIARTVEHFLAGPPTV